MSDPVPRSRSQRPILIGLALLFFAPLALAFFLYYGPAWHPVGHVNVGDLIVPARPLPTLRLPLMEQGQTDPKFLEGKWTFLYIHAGPCAADCLARLYDTRQVRLALDRDMGRVQRVFIGDAGCCELKSLREQHPDLIEVRTSPDAAPLLALLPQAGAAASRVYVIDPLGNLMMSYAANAKSKGMLEDMKRLLRLSSIG